MSARVLYPQPPVGVPRQSPSALGYIAQWRQALQVIDTENTAAAWVRVRVRVRLPPDLVGFTGRTAELDRLSRVRGDGRSDGETVVITAIEGMARVGKTQLTIHAGHIVVHERRVDRVLFVNLREFHPDPT